MVRRQQMADRALRPAMRSPGRPIPARHVEREFWRLIAAGKSTEEAAAGVGVSVPVGSRWFRHAGGMSPITLCEPTGRYLSFAEREEVAILRAQDHGVREIARRLGRDPSTISNDVLDIPAAVLDAPNTCPLKAQGAECQPFYEMGMAPPGKENLGVCGLPP